MGQQKASNEEMDKRVTQVAGRVDVLHEHVNQIETSIEVRQCMIKIKLQPGEALQRDAGTPSPFAGQWSSSRSLGSTIQVA